MAILCAADFVCSFCFILLLKFRDLTKVGDGGVEKKESEESLGRWSWHGRNWSITVCS